MKKSDFEQIRLVVREEIRTELEPIRDMVNSHQQTLHGAESEGGLIKEVNSIRRKVFLVTSGIAGAITAGFNLVIYYLGKR